MAWQTYVSLGLLIVKVSKSHSDTPNSVRLSYMSDRSVAETSTWQHTTLTRDNISMPPAGFEPPILANDLPQDHALHRAATGIGSLSLYLSFSLSLYIYIFVCTCPRLCPPDVRGFDIIKNKLSPYVQTVFFIIICWFMLTYWLITQLVFSYYCVLNTSEHPAALWFSCLV